MAGPSVSVIIGYVIAVIYVALGLAVLTQGVQYLRLSVNVSIILGVLLIIYGVMRGYRAYQKSL